MANFKVGQRVRITDAIVQYRECVGREATIMALPGAHWLVPDSYGVHVDGVAPPPYVAAQGCFWGDERCFSPLTDPSADAFMERIKNLKPYEEPKVTEEPFTIAGVLRVRNENQ